MQKWLVLGIVSLLHLVRELVFSLIENHLHSTYVLILFPPHPTLPPPAPSLSSLSLSLCLCLSLSLALSQSLLSISCLFFLCVNVLIIINFLLCLITSIELDWLLCLVLTFPPPPASCHSISLVACVPTD